ncbi:uncharacterized protein LOC129965925 [Argiope bruennichi]|uniref:uncharacterized protein LOC129965925 n=1 Tax=Argiope bruennichi TaxID=94029 RepID=UPI00249412A4|nr:uncharacterized protein LOC129965925 [Argiope bruennichi]
MKRITVIFLLLGCHLSCFHSLPTGNSHMGCRIVHSPVGIISEFVALDHEFNFCWIIPVSTGKYIEIKMNNLTLQRDCFSNYVEISSAEKEEKYKFCQFSSNSVTLLSNVTIMYKESAVDTFYDYGRISGFRLEYIIRDIECVNKGSFRCSNTSCIPQAEVCDGIKDCENGADEVGCETGVLSLSGVAEARRKAISWLRKERLASWGWRDYTPRGVVALYLASNVTFNGTILEEELMAKETEIKTAVALLRPALTNSELSMFIHSLLVTCHNPRDFYGNNLIKRLKEQVEESPKAPHPISYLALCNARESWPVKAESDLRSILNSSLEYPFVKDLQAMAILALSCKANSTGSSDASFTSTTSKLYKQVSENLKGFQLQDGSFGNLHTTALITQALISSGLEGSKDWSLNATIQYLMKELDSPSVDFLSVYLTLPILNGKSLMDVYKVNCSANPRKNDEDPVSAVNEFLGPKMRVQYTLYIGDKKDVVHTISLRVPENYTAFQIMQLAEIEDQKYKFEWKVMFGKMYVHKIANISNDPETGKFWLLYVGSNNETETLTHFATGPDNVVMKDEQELIFWFKTANI